MAESLHTVLSKSYTPKLPLTERENLSIKEKGTTYRLKFNKRRQSVVYQIDGVIIKDGDKCDCVILAQQDRITKGVEKWKSIFVELKGTDVMHALKQLDATLDNKLFKHNSIDEVHARIVAKSFPASKGNTEFEKARRKFKAKHKNCSFKQITSNQPDLIE